MRNTVEIFPTFKLYGQYVLRHRKYFFIASALQIAVVLCNMLYPLILALLLLIVSLPIAEVQPNDAILWVLTPLKALEPQHALGLVILAMFFIDASRNYMQMLLQNVLDVQASLIFKQMIDEAVRNFIYKNYNDRININPQRVKSSLTRVYFATKSLQSGLFGRVFPTILEIFLSISIIFSFIGPLEAILFASMIAAFITYSFFFSKKTDSDQISFQRQFIALDTTLNDIFTKHDEVVSFGGHLRGMQRVNDALGHQHNANLQAMASSRRFFVLQVTTIFVIAYLIILSVSSRVLGGEAISVSIVLVVSYVHQFVAPLNTIGFYLRSSVRDLRVVQEIADLLNPAVEKGQLEVSTSSREALLQATGIEFSHDGKPLLRDVELSLDRGQHLSLLGPNGSGKSTLARILTGQITPTKGNVIVDENELHAIRPEQRARLALLVPQSGDLFAISLTENIAFPSPVEEIDWCRVISLLEELGSANIVARLKNELHGEKVDNAPVSGGERQKILLIRTIIHAAPLIVLDESTANIDEHSAAKILKLLKRECPTSAVIIITHDSDLALDCERTLALNNAEKRTY